MRVVFPLPLARQSCSFFAVFGLTHPDLRQGLSAVEANRREYLFVLACESPVLALAFFSLRWLKTLLFWLGWGIHIAFTACISTVVIWLKFFWHCCLFRGHLERC